MLKLNRMLCAIGFALVLSGCTSAQIALPPVVVEAPQRPAPPAWMMEPRAPNFTERTLKLFSPSSETPTTPPAP